MIEITFKINESKINERFEQWLFENKVIDDNVELDESKYQKVVDVFSNFLSTNEYNWLDSLDEAIDEVCSKSFKDVKKTHRLKLEFVEEIEAKSEDEANDKFIELIKKTSNEELIENADIAPEE